MEDERSDGGGIKIPESTSPPLTSSLVLEATTGEDSMAAAAMKKVDTNCTVDDEATAAVVA